MRLNILKVVNFVTIYLSHLCFYNFDGIMVISKRFPIKIIAMVFKIKKCLDIYT